MHPSEGGVSVPIRNPADIVLARRAARAMAERLGFGKADQTRLATAVSELTRNVIQYAERGQCRIADASSAKSRCIRIVVDDHGPGIANIALAMLDGYSTGGGLGAGLPGTRRLTDSFDIESSPGKTRITITLSAHRSII